MASKVSVFIGSSSEGKRIAHQLDAWLTNLGGDEVSATVWTDLDGPFRLNEAYLESLIKASRKFDFAVLVATADDSATVRKEQISQARDNVIFELGLFMGKLGRTRTFLVCADGENLRLPSDLSGISVLRFSQRELPDGDPDTLKRVCQKLLYAINSCSDEDGGFFVLFPSLRNDPFYLNLMAGIAAPSSGTRDVTFLLPREAYSGPQFLEKLDELVAKQRGFKGGLIAPTLSGMDPEEIRRRIAQFSIPIVLMDVNPYEGLELPEKVCYVGVDNYGGGRLAAIFMREWLKDVAKPRVLVLANNDQAQRYKGFHDELAGAFDIHMEICKFSADDGRNTTARVLKHHADSSRPFHGVFAVSDELALGAIDVLPKVAEQGPAKGFVVVGFDGLPTAKILIDTRLTHLRNTVVQDSYELGQRSMGMLKDIVAGSPVTKAKRERLLPVQMYV